jgi:hypothetical protein
MVYPDSHPPYFLCLCSIEHRAALAAKCAEAGQDVEFVDQVEDLLLRGLERPPLGLILEIATVVRVGAERMSKFLNLDVSWPVMRCALAPDGEARIMCFEPAHGEPLVDAMRGIASGDPAWKHPRFHRLYLRLEIPGRVRLCLRDEARWRLGNLLDISCGGCFIAMTSDAPPLGSELSLELVDFTPEPQLVRGTVIRVRPWEESLELPGIGVEFDPLTIGPAFRRYLTESTQFKALLAD